MSLSAHFIRFLHSAIFQEALNIKMHIFSIYVREHYISLSSSWTNQ